MGLSCWLALGYLTARMIPEGLDYTASDKSGLLWREMYLHCEHHGHVDAAGRFRLSWDGQSSSKVDFSWLDAKFVHSEAAKKWLTATTGEPLVDACMNELMQTGRLANRGRMILASWLICDANSDWRIGEQHFREHLADYDPVQNVYNWHWMFRKRHYRKLVPAAQAKKYKLASYIARWN